jgi:hypothetical protein
VVVVVAELLSLQEILVEVHIILLVVVVVVVE